MTERAVHSDRAADTDSDTDATPHPSDLTVEAFLDAYSTTPYSVVERTEKCGKDACACTDDPDAEHGPYRYHVYTEPDGSRRWEYQGPAYDL